MCAVLRSVEVHHAIQTGVAGTITLIAMGIQLLLRQDVAARLSC